ncbi:Asp23/Gls24 family envelope stress response protein [Streptomyces sp. A1136]|uniref:Asp23/Gls24 family envelope stress response protein n=1 Tax=Streptomyces sp. A1136 TaxID=2563102 RepID=UPI00109E959A|nr:Asp23/Gls24 family envelope stress response protein [Streptomyces sp. A1136]THA47743.1 Asp23/Gls24 family envelope stress response protein [Streptomyces sp. A1136]
MSDTINPAAGGGELASSPTPTGQAGAGTAPQSRGRTTISDSVVEKIVGMATREIPGIHSLGAGMARTIGAVKDMVPGGRSSVSRGVKVEVGERQTAVDLDVVVEYGVAIVDLAGEVRRNVISAVERMTGLEVVEVNITVDDVHLPDEEDEDEGTEPTRVQ